MSFAGVNLEIKHGLISEHSSIIKMDKKIHNIAHSQADVKICKGNTL